MLDHDQLDLLDLLQLRAIEIHSWRKRQPKFSYPVHLAQQIGAGAAAALYHILNCIASNQCILSDSDVCASIGAHPADIDAARAYGKQQGFLTAKHIAFDNWRYDLHLVAFSEWAARQKKPPSSGWGT